MKSRIASWRGVMTATPGGGGALCRRGRDACRQWNYAKMADDTVCQSGYVCRWSARQTFAGLARGEVP